MSEVIITGPGSYRTVDGRKVTIEKFTRGSGRAIASNLNCMVGGKRVEYTMQVYDLDGSVFSERSGEEIDRIVGPWSDDVTSPVQEVNTKRVVPGTYGIVTVGRHVDTGAPLVSIPFIPNVTAEQLRDAARILNELADFIDA